MDNFVLQNAGQQHEPRLKHTCGLSNPLKSAFNAWCVTDTVIHMWFHEKNCKTLKVGFFRQIAMFILILLSNKSNFTEKIFKLYKLDFSHFFRENVLVTLWNNNKDCDLTRKMRKIQLFESNDLSVKWLWLLIQTRLNDAIWRKKSNCIRFFREITLDTL